MTSQNHVEGVLAHHGWAHADEAVGCLFQEKGTRQVCILFNIQILHFPFVNSPLEVFPTGKRQLGDGKWGCEGMGEGERGGGDREKQTDRYMERQIWTQIWTDRESNRRADTQTANSENTKRVTAP